MASPSSSAAPSASSSAAPSVSAAPAPASSTPAAPPEAIALDLGSVKTAFQSAGQARFLDVSGRFSFEDRAKISQAVADLSQKTGAKVWALALPGKTDVNTYAAIHAELKMTQKDVLLIFSGDKRHLHSQALPKTIGNEILKETNAAFYKSSQTTGVVQMLEAVGTRLSSAAPSTTASVAAPTAPAGPKKPSIPLDGILVVVAVAVIGWMLLKNRTPSRSSKSTSAPSSKTSPSASGKAPPKNPQDDEP